MTQPTVSGTEDVNGPEPDLKRVLGPKLLLLFIVGDILGAGIYAVTGQMALEVGGVVWLPFLVAFLVATLTALSYLELVTSHPQAAGAALYTHKAFGIHFVTFLVAFAVVCSGITSASTSSNLLATNLLAGLDINGIGISQGKTAITAVSLGFMLLLALVNLRGVGESVKFNVVLTAIEVAALVIVIGIGFWVVGRGDGDLGRITTFESGSDRGLFLAVTVATSIAFFAMVGFEDSVNMVEETQEPERIFPRVMLTGLGIAVIVYMLVAITVIAVIPQGDIESVINDGDGQVLLNVVRLGAPDLPIDRFFPFLTCVAVANTALINMLMASRLIYGMANQDVLPRALGKVLPGRRTPYVGIAFTTVLALGLLAVAAQLESSTVATLSGTTALLLLGVFAVVNVACLALRRDPRHRDGFRAPTVVPYVGVLACVFLVGPWAKDEANWVQYKVAGGMLAVGVVLWALTWFVNRGLRGQKTGFRDIDRLE